MGFRTCKVASVCPGVQGKERVRGAAVLHGMLLFNARLGCWICNAMWCGAYSVAEVLAAYASCESCGAATDCTVSPCCMPSCATLNGID
jgi:hypothetical protein